MSIHGIGCDMLQTGRVAKAYGRYGHKLLARVLTQTEREQACRQLSPIGRLAKYMAAKEAAFKALGVGRDQGIGWHDFEVTYAKSGQPQMHLYGAARAKLPEGARLHLSLSDTDEHALAYVIIEAV